MRQSSEAMVRGCPGGVVDEGRGERRVTSSKAGYLNKIRIKLRYSETGIRSYLSQVVCGSLLVFT